MLNSGPSHVNVSSGVPQSSKRELFLFSLYMSSYKAMNTNVHAVNSTDEVSLVVPVYRDEDDITCDVESEPF